MKRILAVLLLWFPFSIAALVAIPVLLFSIIAEDESIWKPVGRAMDKLLAAILGFSGNHTLSAELGASTDYRWLRKFLDLFEAGHCMKAAKSEGLL